jgi:hypothetical protein
MPQELGQSIINITGEVLFEMAPIVVKKHCREIHADVNDLSPEQARLLSDSIGNLIMTVYGERVARPIIHQLKVLVADTRFQEGNGGIGS